MAREDMQEFLNAWIPGHGLGNLQSLWRRSGEVRRRVADIVCTELEHWRGDNSVSEVDDQGELTALIAATYFDTPERLFEPMLALRETADIDDLLGAYHTLGGEDVTALRDPGGMIRLTRGDAVADQALLVSALAGDLQLTQEGIGTSLARQGRRVTVLLLDQLHQQYIESARTELGRELLLLADSLLVGELCRVLEQVAEPGFTVIQSGLAGLPEGWALITGIWLHSLPEQADGVLQPLRPRSRTQVEFDGGMQLTDGRWHASSAPAVIAVDGAGREFRVTLYRESGRTGDEPIDLGAHQAEARIPLSDRGLEDGNYRVVLTAAAGGAHLTSRALKLRSSRTAHLDPPVELRLEHDASPDFDHRAALSAEEPNEAKTTSLRGAIFNRHEGLRAVPDANLHNELGGMEPFESLDSWVARVYGRVTEASLAEAHEHLRLGHIEQRNGELKLTPKGEAFRLERVELEKRRSEQRSVRTGIEIQTTDLDRILDALVVSQAGSWNSFRRLIDYSESERFAPHEAMRNLRGLGYIDVEVDARSMYPRRWSLTPAAMVVMPDRTSAVLTGRRSPQILSALVEAVERCGGAFIRAAAPARPERVELTAADPGMLVEIGRIAEVDVVFDAPRRIVERMPSIRNIIINQPELYIPDNTKRERFDAKSNKWREVEQTNLAGAYQITSDTTHYAVNTDGVMRECGNSTAKYAGAAAIGQHIMAYDAETRRLTCLFGARPPGLFERALILCSGELPESPGDHTRIYRDVPPHVQAWIAALLGPQGWGA